MIYELHPKYDSRQSFYGKARVEQNDSQSLIKLYSYDTHVASIEYSGSIGANGLGTVTTTATVYDTYSNTTLRHIKEFLKQHGFKADSKAQIVADYMGGE